MNNPATLFLAPSSLWGSAHTGRHTRSLDTYLTPQGRVPVGHVRQQSDQAEAEALGHREGTWRQRDRSPAITPPGCSPSHAVKHLLPAEVALNGVGPSMFPEKHPCLPCNKMFQFKKLDAS